MPHISAMTDDVARPAKPSQKRGLLARACMFWGGLLLVIVSPLVGAIPGPGGIVVFALGFGLMLRGSTWVKKKYARFKLAHPKKGEWVDFGLRRPSYRRRMERAKADDAVEGIPFDTAATPPRSFEDDPAIARHRELRSRRRVRDRLLGDRHR